MVAIAFVLAICALMLMAVMSVQIRDAVREQADVEREQACWAKVNALADATQRTIKTPTILDLAVKDCFGRFPND